MKKNFVSLQFFCFHRYLPCWVGAFCAIPYLQSKPTISILKILMHRNSFILVQQKLRYQWVMLFRWGGNRDKEGWRHQRSIFKGFLPLSECLTAMNQRTQRKRSRKQQSNVYTHGEQLMAEMLMPNQEIKGEIIYS